MSAARERFYSGMAAMHIDNPDQYKAYLTITGAIVLHFLTGANQLGNIITYMTSYMHKHVSEDITYSKDMWFTTVSVLAFTVFTIIGGYSTRILPLRAVLMIGVSLISLGSFLISFAIHTSFLATILSASFIISAGSGFVYTNSIIASSKWFPNQRGFITGTIVALDSIATFGTMLAQTEYLNPNNVRADNQGFIVDDAVLDRLPTYFRFVSVLFLAVGSVGVLFTYEAPPNNQNQIQDGSRAASPRVASDERQHLLERSSDEDSVVAAASTIANFIENDVIDAIPDDLTQSGPSSPPQPVKNYYGVRKALKTRMAMILFITFGLSTLSSYFISIMAKPFGQFINDDKFLALIVSLGNFANFVGSFACGKLMDKIKFKHTMLIVNCTVAASYFSLIFCQYWHSRLLYAIWILLINVASIGFFTSHLPEVMNKFGDKHSSAIYGVIHIGPVISSLICTPLLEELIDSYKPANGELFPGMIHYGYYYAFLAIGALNFVSMVILMIFYRTHTVI